MKANTSDPAPDAEEIVTYIHEAQWAIQEHRFDEAEEALQRALILDEEQPAVHNLLGVLHEIHGELRKAQNSYREALNLDSKYEPARFNLRQSVQPHGKRNFMLSELKRSEGDDRFESHMHYERPQ